MTVELWTELKDAMHGNGERVAVVVAQPAALERTATERRVLYRELVGLAEDRGRALLAHAGATRRRVVLGAEDPFDTLVSILGCWSTGLVPVATRERTPTAAALELAVAVGAATLVTREALVTPNENVRTPQYESFARSAPSAREALVLTTSGTSGLPKLVALPDSSVRLNATTIGRLLDVTHADRFLVAQPLSHVYGLVGSALVAFFLGAEAHVFDSRTPSPILQSAIRKSDLSVVQGAPTFWRMFLGYWKGEPFQSVKAWTTASEQPGRALLERVGAALPAARGQLGFGMTEAGPRVSHIDVDDPAVVDGGMGVPFAHLQWRVDGVDRNVDRSVDRSVERGVERSAGYVGRLALRGPSMLLGYIDGNAYTGLGDDGFFLTSDLVSPHADGSLRYRGRADTRVKVGDHLLNPTVVEQFLLGLPGVLDARCFAEPHDVLGHVLVAEVVPAIGAGGRDAVGGADLDVATRVRSACSEALDPALVPRSVRIVSELATTAAGKRARTILGRELA